MPLSAQNAITKVVLASVKTALASYIPTVVGAVPANIADAHAGLTEGGEPHALAGEWFAGVHKDPTSVNQPQPGGRTAYTDETFTQLITFSMRVTRYASDRVAKDGYPLLQEKVRVVGVYFLNNMETIRAAINTELDLSSTNGFLEPFGVANLSPGIQKRGKSWYKAGRANVRGVAGNENQGTLAVSATLRLEGLRRIQLVGNVN